ncbi:MAG: nitrile hydratase subunit alpha [Actinobacteria bacterium]|nr:nitrile hydratase subunit alpha [Actinomycetota bacterium]
MSQHDEFPELRTKAIESLLIEKGLITEEAIDKIVDTYEHDIGPMRGARVVARAWTDPEFKARLLDDATAAMAELEVGGFVAEAVVAVENTEQVHNMVACTLCSCYPWGVLGLPPSWYKDPAYRSRVVREPRAVLAEFGTELPADVEVRVWDSSSEVRYMVIPRRPPGTEEMTEDELAPLVTRDSMIGTAVLA